MVRGLRCVAACAVFAFLVMSPSLWLQSAIAQEAPRLAANTKSKKANSVVVGIISGELNSTSLAMTSDLAMVLNRPGVLRIVPMIGSGPVQTIKDILYLRGTDLGIVRSDVLNHFKNKKGNADLRNRIHFIAKLHNEEVHVLSRMNFLCLSDLSGKRVNFGLRGSGSNLTASLVLAAHGVKVQPVYFDQLTALEKLKNGEIDATVVVSGKPSPIFNAIKYTDRVHFLDVEFKNTLRTGYLPSVMSFDDYPDLIARNETVSTISVSVVMAAYNWKVRTPRSEKVARFVALFFDNFDKFKQKGRHPKWREVDLGDKVRGWTRLAAADQWLKKNKPELMASAGPGRKVKASFQRFLSQRAAPGGPKKELSPQEQEALFNQFVSWMKKKPQ